MHYFTLSVYKLAKEEKIICIEKYDVVILLLRCGLP